MSDGRRRQRLSGRRRSAPRPEQGASTRTRSNEPSRHGAGCRHPRRRRPSSPASPGRPAAPGAAGARWRAAGRLAGSPAPRAGRPCHRGRRTGPASGRPGPRPRRGTARRATSWEPASWTPARPSRTAGHLAGVAGLEDHSQRRDATAGGAVEGPAVDAASSSTVDSPGRATSVTRGRSLSAASSVSSSSGRSSARASSSTTHCGCENRTAVRGVQVVHPASAGRARRSAASGRW